jgi:glucans biosynthesis protein C
MSDGIALPDAEDTAALNRARPEKAMNSGADRLHYLDALRCFCMIFGIFVHGTTLFEPRILTVIPLLSDHFRMATFFAVSGFFAALLSTRMTWPMLLRRRSLALLVPLATVLILLNPLTNYLVYLRHNSPMPIETYFFEGGWRLAASGPMVWHLHLWFLISLWLYFLTVPIFASVTHNRLVDGFVDAICRLPSWFRLSCLAALIAAATVVLRAIYAVLLDPILAATPFAWVIRATLQYAPMFALGMLLFRRPILLENFQRIDPMALILGLAGVVLVNSNRSILGPLAEIATVGAKFFLITACVAALFFIFSRFFYKSNSIIRKFTDSMYSIYLLHYFVIYCLVSLIAPQFDNPYWLYIIVTGLTLLITYLLHQYLINRSTVLSYALNGRAPRQSP